MDQQRFGDNPYTPPTTPMDPSQVKSWVSGIFCRRNLILFAIVFFLIGLKPMFFFTGDGLQLTILLAWYFQAFFWILTSSENLEPTSSYSLLTPVIILVFHILSAAIVALFINIVIAIILIVYKFLKKPPIKES